MQLLQSESDKFYGNRARAIVDIGKKNGADQSTANGSLRENPELCGALSTMKSACTSPVFRLS